MCRGDVEFLDAEEQTQFMLAVSWTQVRQVFDFFVFEQRNRILVSPESKTPPT
jgi:hypothetical protein